MSNNLKLTLPEFTHIYNTLNSIYNSELIIDLEESAFFSIFAATILKNHYNFNAIPVCGDVLYYLEDDLKVEYNQENIKNNNGDNHSLVVADGWFFDFTSPNMTKERKKMIQKRGDKINDIDSQKKKGYIEFWHIPEKMEKHLIIFNEDENLKELCKITNNWFNKNPKKMDKTLEIIDKENIQLLKLLNKEVKMIKIELSQTSITEKF